jgi:hypothetical protein
MGIFNKIRGGSGAGKGYNPYQLKPAVGAKVDTHTVRDDSQNTTQAMTQRRADRDAASTGNGGPSILQSDADRKRVKIGAEYTTYHEPDSPEGSAILKDKKKTAKALKKVNSPKVMGEARAAAGSFEVAKKEETRRTKNNKMLGLKDGDAFAEEPSGSEAAYLKGGAKAEQSYRQAQNRKRMGG